jgi:sigma-B regulation protein RsbU (phosphoserine phosphatase)
VRAKLATSDYDLVLMDLNYARDTTSGDEGLQLLADVHANDPLLPVLVMTGWGSIDTAVEAMRRGACGFVHKPWDNEALTTAIRRQVEDGRTLRRNHQRASREHQEAQAIQRALLPLQLPHGVHLDIAAQWKPASTFGGDLYDVTPLEEGRLAISIGDVCGKGLPAALLMANVQATVRAFAALEPSPARLVARVNHDLARHTTLRRFVTFFFGIYDIATHRLRYCNAGHNPPIVLRADRSTARLDSGGTVLGALETSLYDEGCVDLAPRDRIVLFTDGITEARTTDDREFGDDALLAVLHEQPSGADGSALIDAVFERAAAFAGGDFQDDATVVVMSIR